MPGRPCYLMLWTVVVWLLPAAVMPDVRAAVYRHTDAHGHVVWSDRPGGTRAEVRAPRVLSPAGASSERPITPSAPAAFTPYQYVRLKPRSAPVSVERARRGIPLRLEIVPRLREGDRVQLRVDGKRHQSPLASRVLMAIGLEAGRHELIAEVLDRSGTVRQRSPVMTLEVVSSPDPAPASPP
ncbi:DUF4124 domain-containing protein [Kushneria sp. AK178]